MLLENHASYDADLREHYFLCAKLLFALYYRRTVSDGGGLSGGVYILFGVFLWFFSLSISVRSWLCGEAPRVDRGNWT